MPIGISEVRTRIHDFLENSLDSLFIASGILLLVISLLFTSPFYGWLPALSLFFGVVFLVSGMAIRLEGPLTLTKPSKSGFGTILICVSLVMLASVGVCVLFVTPSDVKFYDVIFRFWKFGTQVIIDVVQPLIWLVTPLIIIGLCSLSVGILLKIYDNIPPLRELKASMRAAMKETGFTIFRLKKSPLSIVGIGIIMFFVAIAFLAPILAPPGDPTQNGDVFMIPKDGYTPNPKPPSLKHPFGTTRYQYDIYYGCIWGTIYTFRMGISTVSLSLAIGLTVGIIAGYFGGFLGDLMMMTTDIMLAFPRIILVMVIWAVLYPLEISRTDILLLALAIGGWASYSRVIRAGILQVKEEDYVEAAKAVGCSDLRIIFRHILPNSLHPIIIMATLDMGAISISLATLAFLGFSPLEGYADWGQMIALARTEAYLGSTLAFFHWHSFFIPSIFISAFALGWNLLGDALRDALDPVHRRK